MFRRIIYAYSFVMVFLMIAAFGTASAALGENTYTEVVGKQSSYELTAAVSRGTIYDREMQPLTNASEKYIAAVIPSVESVARLNSITDKSRREEIKNALESGRPFLISVNSPVSTDGI